MTKNDKLGDADVEQRAQTITNFFDLDDDGAHEKKDRPRTPSPYKHITVRGIVLTTLACYTLGCITACAIIQSSIEKSHKMAMERDIFVQSSLGQITKMNQQSLDAMRHTVDSVFSSSVTPYVDTPPNIDIK